LAVIQSGSATFAPGSDMVGIHFAQLPEFTFVGIMSKGTQWAV
jgi:hypothetical protein